MDFIHETSFTIEDLIHAQEQYDKLLHMAQIKAEFVRGLKVNHPLGKVIDDIHRATLTEMIHIHKIQASIKATIDSYLKEHGGGNA